MTDGSLSLLVGRGVIGEVVRRAALEIPEILRVGRGGARWRIALGGSPIRVRVRDGEVAIRLSVIARPGADLVVASRAVRTAVGAAIERLLALRVAAVTVIVDGIGS
jgi:uncharacterized alkaline shock family protein YloU